MKVQAVAVDVLSGEAVISVDGRAAQAVRAGDTLTVIPRDPQQILRDLGAANLPVPYWPRSGHRAAVLSVLTLHRRSHNTRACTGCPWTPPHAGGTDAGAATRRRNEDFNTHLADLITDLFC